MILPRIIPMSEVKVTKTPPIHLHISISVKTEDDKTPTFDAKLHQGEVVISCREPALVAEAITDPNTPRRRARGL